MSYNIFLSGLLFLAVASAVQKKWVADTDFGNPLNWSPQRTPCGNDVVILPTDMPVIFVQVNTTIKEMYLPTNGELIFGQNMNIGFTQETQPGCPGGEVDFQGGHHESWLNPNNWCSSINDSGDCDLKPTVLEVERVPCNYDSVIFPANHLYRVDLTDSFSVTLKSFKFQQASFISTQDLTNYINSTEGQKIFFTKNGTQPLSIDRAQRCHYSIGCPCGNDKAETASIICQFVKCQRVRCQNAIKPVGSCCNMCGAAFNITSGDGFTLQKFTTDLRNSFLPAGSDNDISMTPSITSEGWIQLVLTDTSGDKSISLARDIQTALEQDIKTGGHVYNIDALSVTFGTPVRSDQQSQTRLKGQEITGIVIGVLIFIAVTVFLLFFFVFKGRKLTLPRLGDLSIFSRGRPRPTAHVMPHTASHIDPGFANPLYDTSPFGNDDIVFKEMKDLSLHDDVATFDVSERGFQNPMFGVQQEGGLAVTSESGASVSINIKHVPKDSSI